MSGIDRSRAKASFVKCVLAAATLALAAGGAQAADLLPTTKAAPQAPAPEALSPFFVKVGFVYAINQSTSSLYAGGVQIPGVGANIANVATLGIESGYYVTPNISVDISGGIPLWAKVKTTGASIPLGGGAAPGTKLSTIMPAFVPLTLLYHFNQFGAVQPYVGGGVAAMFSFAQRNGFTTDVTIDPTIGLVLQAGADVMIDQHWGWSFDVKKLFANGQSHSTGLDLSYVGIPAVVPSAGLQKTNFTPWVLSTGVIHRF